MIVFTVLFYGGIITLSVFSYIWFEGWIGCKTSILIIIVLFTVI